MCLEIILGRPGSRRADRCPVMQPSDTPELNSADHFLIAIIDDDQPFRDSMQRLMRSLGYAGEVFASAGDFLASSHLRQTSCLISDVQMPVMSGLELFRHLVRTGHPIPTILVTAYPREVDKDSALKEGVVCYLPKPIHEQALSQCLHAALASGEA